MRKFVLFFCFFLSALFGGDVLTARHAKNYKQVEVVKTPIETKSCIAHKINGDCAEYEVTYGVGGVTCTEDCLVLNKLSLCVLHNRCTYDTNSGCFTKRVCSKTHINPLNNCTQWDEIAVCK